MRLNELQAMNAISGSLEEVRVLKNDVISASDFEMMSDAERAKNKKVVVLDKPEWIATTRRRAPREANVVYSGSGMLVGVWKKGKGFSFTTLTERGSLAVQKRILIKEDLRMDATLTAMDEFEKDFEAQVGAAPAVATAGADDKKSEKEREQEKIVNDIKKKTEGVHLADVTQAQLMNAKKGRLMFFITKTDSSTKVSKINRALVDANGKRIPAKDADPEKVAKYTDKVLPLSLCEKEVALGFKNTKPGTTVGIALAVPVGSDMSLSTIGKEVTVKDDDTLVYKLMTLEQAYSYVSYNFGKYPIKESEEVLGNRAGSIKLDFKTGTKTDATTGAVTTSVKPRFILNKTEGARKSMITEGNYFPIQIFKTLSPVGASSEDAKTLDLNVEALLTKKDFGYNDLCDESKGAITQNGDGSFSTAWFDKGESISVKRYDDKDLDVTDIKIPVRMKKENEGKNGLKVTYPYVKIDADAEGGSLQKYAALVKAVHMDSEAFYEKVKGMVTRKSGTKKSNKATVSAEDWLKMRAMGNSVGIDLGTTKPLADLAGELELGM